MVMTWRKNVVFAPEDGTGTAAPSGAESGAQAGSAPTGGGAAPSAPSGATPSPRDSGSGVSGGAPTTPGSATEPAPAPAPPDDPFDFGDEASWLGGEIDAPAVAPSPQELSPPEPAPVAPVVQAETVPQPAAPQVATKPEGGESRAPQDQGGLPHLSLAEPGNLGRAMVENMAQLVEPIAAQYALSAEEREAVENDFVGSIPTLAAKMHIKVVSAVLQNLESIVPTMMMRQMELMQRSASNAQRFFDKWPQLDRQKHMADAMTYAKAFRTAHPQASVDELIASVGPMVMMKNGLVPTAPNHAAPTAPARAPQPSPFQPVANGGAAMVPQTSNENPWSDPQSWFGGDDD